MHTIRVCARAAAWLAAFPFVAELELPAELIVLPLGAPYARQRSTKVTSAWYAEAALHERESDVVLRDVEAWLRLCDGAVGAHEGNRAADAPIPIDLFRKHT